MKKGFFHTVFVLCFITLCRPVMLTAQSPVRQVRLSRFTLQSSAVVASGGDSLSSVYYSPKNYWFPVTVPCTVLTGLVANKVYPDPYIGMNNMLIPDANDSFNNAWHLGQYSHMPGEPNPWKKPYWYRTTFSVPAADKGRHFQLIFKGINYRAEVWLNGRMLADSARMVGMFEEFDLDASAAIRTGEENALAVKIYPLDYPGLPAAPQVEALDDFGENGGPTGDIGKNVTMLSSIGWDWIPEVHDRNMGIWQPVYLRTTGQVVISKPRIITDLPNLPDTSLAKLSIDVTLSNNSASPRKGSIQVTISPDNFMGANGGAGATSPAGNSAGAVIRFTKPATIDASGSIDIHLSAADIPELTIHRPKLWWPNGYGNPNLYRLRLRYTDEAGGVSDDTSIVFGIRTVSSAAVTFNDWTRRDFYVKIGRAHV